MTSLVLEGLYLLKDAGYSVDQSMQTRGLKWLQDNTAALEKQLTHSDFLQLNSSSGRFESR